MYINGPARPLFRGGKAALIPALACAAACIALMRAGFFTFFFLVPLGFCAAAFGPAPAWIGFIIAALGNCVLSLGYSLRYGAGQAGAHLDILYFTVFALGFTWIMAGNPPLYRLAPPGQTPALPRVRTVFRFTAASAAGALALIVMAYAVSGDEGFSAYIRSQIEAISSAYISSLGTDAAQRAYLERALTTDKIIEAFYSIVLRGGALASAFFLFFASRQAAFLLARIFRRLRGYSSDLTGFHVPRQSIWVLSLCLPVILAFRVTAFKIGEIAAWNLLVICAIMFLAQGGGIVLFTLTRRPLPGFMRLLFSFMLVLLLFSPGVNAAVMGALIILGIAENWLPLRVIKQNQPVS